MRRRLAEFIAGGATSIAALVWASSFVTDVFDHQPALGDPLVSVGDMRNLCAMEGA